MKKPHCTKNEVSTKDFFSKCDQMATSGKSVMSLIDRLKEETNHSNSLVLLVCYYKTTVIKHCSLFNICRAHFKFKKK